MAEPISLDYLRDLLDLAREAGVLKLSAGGVSVEFAPAIADAPYAEPPLPPRAVAPVTDPSAPPLHPSYSSPMLFRNGRAPGWRKNTEV